MGNKFKLFIILTLCMLATGMKAADVSSSSGMSNYTLKYQSVDAQNKKITLSAKLYYMPNKTIDFVAFNQHATITNDSGSPTGSSPQLEAIKYMVSENALVICADYIGFGETKSIIHPYMCSTLTARNLLDCYKAAVQYVKNTLGLQFKSNYYTINLGYSQGGATALAFQKYLETQGTAEEKALVNLRGSVCGAGPYNQQIVFDTYEKYTSLDYPVYLYYILRGHKQAFGETTMRNLELEECFTTKFWSYVESTLQDQMNNKVMNVDDINTDLKNNGFNTFYDIINADYKNHNSKVYRTIHKVLAQSNLLANDGWTPTAPIILYHEKTGKDIVVPYATTEAARTRFAGKCTYVDAIDDYGYDCTFNSIGMANGGDNYKWHPAVFREIWENAWTYPGQNTIIAGAAITGNTSYTFSQLDHRTFGARFYAQFLAGRMRPSGSGTGSTSYISIATPDEVSFSATETVASGSHYRLTTALPYALPVGEYTFVQFPAKVDGFYFGHDAPRYKVTLNDKGEVTAYQDFSTTEDDFEAGQVYLIKSNEALTSVLSMTAGIALPTVSTPITWRELNIRKLNQLNGTGYATAYMPFAYTSEVAYTGENNGDNLVANQSETIAAGTGALLVNPGSDATTLLTPIIENPTAVSSESDLLGTYTEISNNNYLTFGRSKNTGAVGFYKYTGSTIKPYSCYLNDGSEAKALVFSTSETAIDNVQSSTKSDIFSLEGIRKSGLTKGMNIIRKGNETIKIYIK